MNANYFKTLFLGVLFFGGTAAIFAQTPEQINEITRDYDQTRLTQLEDQLAQTSEQEKQAALQQAALRGLEIRVTLSDGGVAELQKILPDGTPIYYRTYNVDAAVSTRTNHLNSGGSLGLNLMGQNMTAHVWDGGHGRVSHQEYDGAGGSNRLTIRDAATEGGTQLNFHAAHVTGTIMASGVQAAAQGMAPHARVDGYMWNNDASEATNAAANGMLISNHSYGFRSDLVPDQWFGAYIDESRTWDEIHYNAPYYLMVVAAGNDGNQNTYNGAPLDGNSSYDKLTGHSTSKNNLVVANAQDANIDADGNLISVSINSSSSEGPTDDYRIKPDITGNGTGLYSTYHNTDTAYNSITGTSMASPNVAGSLLLLQQHYNDVNNTFARSATIKGLALHTADDIGQVGPDAVHGWGLLNAKKAAQAITDNGTDAIVDERTLTQGGSYSIDVDAAGGPLYVSISWTDAPGTATSATNSNTARLVNDLDVRITKDGTTYEPWRLTGVTTNGKGDNTKDPYERVDIGNATAGTYTITVTHKGTLSSGSQDYTLIVTGIGNSTPPPPPTCYVGDVDLSITFDNYPEETAWTLTDASGTTIQSETYSTANPDGSTVTATFAGLAPGEYVYTITDVYGDGICCAYGNGSYTLTAADGTVIKTGGSFGSAEATTFCIEEGGTGPDTEAPSDVTGLTASSITETTATLSWNASTDNVGVTGYEVFQGGTSLGTVTGTSANITSLTADTAYTFSVTAFDAAGNVSGADTVTFTTQPEATDTQAPTTPTGLNASSITQTSATLSWNASSDDTGVAGYEVFQGGASLGTVTGTSADITGLTADTAYTFSVTAFDAAGNTSGAASVTFTTLPDSTGGPVVLHEGYFESGWDGWADGGSDAARLSTSRSYEGSYSIRLRDNTNSSTMTLSGVNLTGFSNVEVDFYFYARSMESGEDFWLQYNSGSGWQTVGVWARGTNFNNNTFYNASVTLQASDYNFVSNAQFRFRNDASSNADYIYIDAVTITGDATSTSSYSSNSLNELISFESFSEEPEEDLDFEGEFALYPNPTVAVLTIKVLDAGNDATYRVINMLGQEVLKGKLDTETVDVRRLDAGVYVIEVTTATEVLSERFIKQ